MRKVRNIYYIIIKNINKCLFQVMPIKVTCTIDQNTAQRWGARVYIIDVE